MNKLLLFLFLLILNISVHAQETTTRATFYEKHSWLDKLSFTGDSRIRLEADWKSRKPDGSYRDDRSRMRYRLRFGFNYELSNTINFGARLRTGNPFDQQGPHTTFGSGSGEFRLGDMNLEKVYISGHHDKIWWWAGKNDFPFWKQNELFWNDNVMPDGVALGLKTTFLGGVTFNPVLSHFIIKSSGQAFWDDAYMQGLQLNFSKKINNITTTVNSALFHFNDVGNLPDGQDVYTLDYKIFVNSAEITFRNFNDCKIGFDLIRNLQDYSSHPDVGQTIFKDEKDAIIFNVKYGSLSEKGDWYFAYYYANMGKYSIVDYFAQNDWARWDYSDIGATGSRLSNFSGHEVRIAYAINKNFNVVSRTYVVKSLKTQQGESKETGSRFRIDLDIKF